MQLTLYFLNSIKLTENLTLFLAQLAFNDNVELNVKS